MDCFDRRFDSFDDAKKHLDWLVESNIIVSYEIRPTDNEYGYDVYIKPVRAVERIDITQVGSSYKQYTIG